MLRVLAGHKHFIDMKKFNLLWMAGICLFSAFAFSACSDDDDENEGNGGSGNGSGISAAYFEADGKRTDYKYAYYWDEGDEVEIDITTHDMRYYYSHPDQVPPGLIVSEIWVAFDCAVVTGDYRANTAGDKTFELETGSWNLYEDVTTEDGYEKSYGPTYETDYTSTQVSSMKVTRSGNTWTMDAPSLFLICEDEWNEYNRPTQTYKTTGKFYFKGSMLLMEGALDEFDDNGTRVVKVEDPGFREWLKQRRKNRSK